VKFEVRYRLIVTKIGGVDYKK